MIQNKLTNYLIPNSINSFLKTFFILNSIIFTIIVLLNVFFDIKIVAYTDYTDIFGDFLKAADSLHITKLWDGENYYDFLLEKKGIHHVVPPFTIFIWAISSYAIKYFLNKYLFYFIFFVLPLCILFIYKSLKFKNFYILLFSYPILIAIQRGNVAILVFIFLFSSFYFFKKEKIITSIFFLILATSLKVTPLLFILLLFDYKNIKKSIKIFLIFILTLLTFNILIIFLNKLLVNRNIYDSMNFFKYLKVYNSYAIEKLGGLRYGSSLYMPILTSFKVFSNNLFRYFTLLNPYLFNLLIFTIFFFIKNKINSIKYYLNDENIKLELITICFLLFMPVTADYYLILLFLPLIFIPFSYFSNIKILAYLLLLIPKEIINTNIFIGKDLPVGAFINPILLLLILFDILKIFNFSEKLPKY
jgi:hypothetical protein